MHVKETSHSLIEVLKKFLSDVSAQKHLLMTVEENQVHAFELTREDLTSSIARLEQSQDQAVAAVAALSEQLASLKVAIKDDKADKAVNLQSTCELEIDLKESRYIFVANQKLRGEELAAQRQVLEILQEMACRTSTLEQRRCAEQLLERDWPQTIDAWKSRR